MTRILPTINLEMVSLTVTAGTALQVKSVSTPCRGILVGGAASGNVQIQTSASGDPLEIPALGGALMIPVADASLIWIDMSAGTQAVGILIFK